jgi:FKBP-type peptidyl-prolyl cis-trans isomerase FkpA
LKTLARLALAAQLAVAPALVGAAALGTLTLSAAPAEAAPPATEEEKVLYSLGLSIARSLAPFDLNDADLAQVVAGLTEGLKGTATVNLETYGPKIGELAQARAGRVAAKSKGKGEAFRTAAAAKPGAKKQASGLIYREIKAGNGKQPTLEDKVSVHYRGTLIDGTEFDSSYSRNQPTEFPLKGVVPCWREGVALMKVGTKAELVCPPELAYGDNGAPPKIGPGETLVFEVELLEVK